MSDPTDTPESTTGVAEPPEQVDPIATDENAVSTDENAASTDENSAEVEPSENNPVEMKVPDFAPLQDSGSSASVPMGRFYDVDVTVWAELGRLNLPLGDLLKLGEGAVVELGRPVSEPVDLVAQGVRVARGEVVVVGDCFALRITEIVDSKHES